jgi:hypothetical protein
MLQNIIDLVKQNANDSIVNNPAIPNEQNEEAINETGNSIMDTLRNALSGGNAQDLIGMLTGGQADRNNPVVAQASGDLTSRLQNKFGLDSGKASGIAGTLVSAVLAQLSQRTADPNDKGFDLQDIVKQLGGGQLGNLLGGSGSIMDKVKGMFN